MGSTENLTSRADAEVAYLMQVIEKFAVSRLGKQLTWQVHTAGDLSARRYGA